MLSPILARFFTISGLVDHSAPFSAEQRAAWAKDAKHWSLASQVLPTPPTARRGSGRHRRYREEDAFVMAIIFRLADMAQPIGVLHAISQYLQEQEGTELWEKAKLGNTDLRVFLSIIFYDEEPFPSIDPGPFSDFPGSTEHGIDGMILMDISAVFAKVRATMEGAPANEE
jgi:hypothetical protein